MFKETPPVSRTRERGTLADRFVRRGPRAECTDGLCSTICTPAGSWQQAWGGPRAAPSALGCALSAAGSWQQAWGGPERARGRRPGRQRAEKSRGGTGWQPRAGIKGMANDRLRVLLFLGSTRAGRIGGRVGRWARAALEARGHAVETVDPLLLSQQDEQVAPDVRMYPMRRPVFFYSPKEKAPLALQRLAAAVEAADAYVMVTPVRSTQRAQIATHPATQPPTHPASQISLRLWRTVKILS